MIGRISQYYVRLKYRVPKVHFSIICYDISIIIIIKVLLHAASGNTMRVCCFGLYQTIQIFVVCLKICSDNIVLIYS